MNLDFAYTPRHDVVSELIDGEAVIIDLATGVYFSLDGAGGRIWELLAAGRSARENLAALVAEYDVDEPRASADLAALIGQMQAEGIVTPVPEPSPSEPVQPRTGAVKLPYQPPRLAVYRDMGDLLALDPPAPGLSEIPWHVDSSQRRTDG